MNEQKNSWRMGLEKTKKVAFSKIAAFFGATDINNETWDDLEAQLIQADIGLETTNSIISLLKEKVNKSGIVKSEELQTVLKEELLSRLAITPAIALERNHPEVILLVGVNGSGKTTTAAKLGWQFQKQGKKILLVAADTYRAAAVDQLQVWGQRLNIPVLAGQPDADPGAVAYDGIQSGIARKMDIIMIDTAGRLHTRYNLMEELKKVYKVIGKACPGAPHAVWLVLDATTGQNAFQQAQAFKEAVHVDGVILAKLDSSAKGGMAFSVEKQLGIPILFAGLGERPEDLQPFDRFAFIDGILS
jgi:fused signal recognition particle receptor